MEPIDLDILCSQLYADIDNIFKKHSRALEDKKVRDIVKVEIEDYLVAAAANGQIYHVPKVEITNTLTGMWSLSLHNQVTGSKVHAIDELISPSIKYNYDKGGPLS